MDRQLEQKKGIRLVFSKKALPFWFGVIVMFFIAWLVFRDDSRKLRIGRGTITVSTVTQGEFNDYIRISGQVVPMTTIQLSPMEGSVVQKIVTEEGSYVHEGDVILVLSNETLDMQILNAEADLAEKENILRNTIIQIEQQKLNLQQEILQLQMEVRRKKRTYDSQKALYNEGLIANETWLQTEEEYQLAKDRLQLVKNRAKQDSLYRSVEIRQMQESLENMRQNMLMIRRRKDNLNIKALIDGELGLLDVELGQALAAGTKIGQINNMESYKIEAQIDEHYIDRITAGLEASFKRQGERHCLHIRKVYPEVREGKFKADFRFSDEQPENIRTGQTFYLNLQLGQPIEAILIPRRAFYQKTGGKWIYVVSVDGKRAVKREIRIGRQNPQYYEVLEGLEPGDNDQSTKP